MKGCHQEPEVEVGVGVRASVGVRVGMRASVGVGARVGVTARVRVLGSELGSEWNCLGYDAELDLSSRHHFCTELRSSP